MDNELRDKITALAISTTVLAGTSAVGAPSLGLLESLTSLGGIIVHLQNNERHQEIKMVNTLVKDLEKNWKKWSCEGTSLKDNEIEDAVQSVKLLLANSTIWRPDVVGLGLNPVAISSQIHRHAIDQFPNLFGGDAPGYEYRSLFLTQLMTSLYRNIFSDPDYLRKIRTLIDERILTDLTVLRETMATRAQVESISADLQSFKREVMDGFNHLTQALGIAPYQSGSSEEEQSVSLYWDSLGLEEFRRIIQDSDRKALVSISRLIRVMDQIPDIFERGGLSNTPILNIANFKVYRENNGKIDLYYAVSEKSKSIFVLGLAERNERAHMMAVVNQRISNLEP